MERRARFSFLASAVLLAALTLAGLLRAGTAEAPRTHTVVIEGMKFTPEVLRIKSGERVLFQNKDLFPHTATAREAKGFDSGLIKPGESWTLQLSGDGRTIRYACLFHPTMEGQVIVERR